MISVKRLREWVATLDDGDDVGISEDGVPQLQVVTAHIHAPYLDVGGMPDEVCDECGARIFYEPETPADNPQHEERCSLYAAPDANPRQKGDDDGREYADPRDRRAGRE